MSKLIVVAMLALWVQPQNDAEKLFNDMVDKLSKANTLQVLFETKIEGAKTGSLKGTLTLATGNKAYVALAGELDGKPIKLTVVSDGVNQRTGTDEKDARRRPTPKGFNDTLTAAVERSSMIVPLFLRVDDGNTKIRETFRASAFKLGKVEMIDDKQAQIIEYQLQPMKETLVQVTLWLDAKTNLPIRRTMRMEVQGRSISFTEQYPSFVLNAKVDDKLFQLPK